MPKNLKVLITGASGFVGQGLAELLSSKYQLTLTSRRPVEMEGAQWSSADLLDSAQVEKLLETTQPDAVIHCAGTKDVKLCEREPELAFRLNAEVTAKLAHLCRRQKIHLVFISTDLVFDGQRGSYSESETPEPALIYGQSKLKGEHLAMEAHDQVSICRTAGVFGNRSPFLKWFREQIALNAPIECFADVYNSPTYLPNLAQMIERVIDGRIYGILHTAGSERASRFDLFTIYADVLKLDSKLVKAVVAGDRRKEMLMLPDSSLKNDQTLRRLDHPRLLTLRESFAGLDSALG